MIQKISQ